MLGNFLGRYCKTAGFLKAVVEGLFPGQKVSLLGVSKNLKADVQHADTSELCKLRRCFHHILLGAWQSVCHPIPAVPLLRCDEQEHFHESSFV